MTSAASQLPGDWPSPARSFSCADGSWMEWPSAVAEEGSGYRPRGGRGGQGSHLCQGAGDQDPTGARTWGWGHGGGREGHLLNTPRDASPPQRPALAHPRNVRAQARDSAGRSTCVPKHQAFALRRRGCIAPAGWLQANLRGTWPSKTPRGPHRPPPSTGRGAPAGTAWVTSPSEWTEARVGPQRSSEVAGPRLLAGRGDGDRTRGQAGGEGRAARSRSHRNRR